MEKCFLYERCNKKCCNASFCIRKYKTEDLCSRALLTKAQMQFIPLVVDSNKKDLDAFKKLSEIEKNIVEFVANGNNLYLYSSNCGNGKTSWAVRLTLAYLTKIWAKSDLVCRALFVNVPRFLMTLKDNITTKDMDRNNYANYIKEQSKTVDLIVWDDIASKLGSEYDIDQIFTIIKTREDAHLSNIYTSNLSPQALYQVLGARIQSRVINESLTIELLGADKRRLRVKGVDGNGSTITNNK